MLICQVLDKVKVVGYECAEPRARATHARSKAKLPAMTSSPHG